MMRHWTYNELVCIRNSKLQMTRFPKIILVLSSNMKLIISLHSYKYMPMYAEKHFEKRTSATKGRLQESGHSVYLFSLKLLSFN